MQLEAKVETTLEAPPAATTMMGPKYLGSHLDLLLTAKVRWSILMETLLEEA
jgi:hypothetical protein